MMNKKIEILIVACLFFPKLATAADACGDNWARLRQFDCDADGWQHQTVCSCLPQTHNDPAYWTNLGDGCYSHYTGAVCKSPAKPIASCGTNWPQLGSFTCDTVGMEHQTICACGPPMYSDLSRWNNLGSGCFSHYTGRTCSPASTTLRGMWDPALSIGTWRTDFNDPSLQTLNLTPCAFNFKSDFNVLAGAGATYWSTITDDVLACDFTSTTYPNSNASTSAS